MLSYSLQISIQAAFDSAKPELIHSLLHLLYPKSRVPMLIAKLNRGCRRETSVNGRSGLLIQLTRDTGQGDPSSAVKFTLDHCFWVGIIHHMIESSTSSLQQLMIDFQEIANPTHDIQIRQSIPRGLPPAAFADNTCLAMRVPADRQAAREFHQLLHNLEEVTGLKVNPSKSEVLILFDKPSDEQLEILEDFGTVKEHVTHLGVVISKEYSQARKLTYEAGKTAMKRASNRVSGGISSTNIILKSQAVNTIVSAINNPRYRVFPPPDGTRDRGDMEDSQEGALDNEELGWQRNHQTQDQP